MTSEGGICGGTLGSFTRCPRLWSHREWHAVRPVREGHRDPPIAAAISAGLTQEEKYSEYSAKRSQKFSHQNFRGI